MLHTQRQQSSGTRTEAQRHSTTIGQQTRQSTEDTQRMSEVRGPMNLRRRWSSLRVCGLRVLRTLDTVP